MKHRIWCEPIELWLVNAKMEIIEYDDIEDALDLANILNKYCTGKPYIVKEYEIGN